MALTGLEENVPPAVDVRNVTKWFPPLFSFRRFWKRRPKVKALDHINLRVKPGTIFALVGPNGAGKTTLLKLLSTLLLPDEGEVRINGRSSLTDASKIRQTLGFTMGHDWGFYWRLTARENLEFFATLYDLSRSETKKKIGEASQLFGMEEYLDRSYQTLSTGMRQRVALARSFLNGATLLLADEPARSLDPLARKELRGLFRKLAKGHGKTVVLATHDLNEAGEVADQIGILHRGRLVKTVTPHELRQSGNQENLENLFAELCRG